MNLAELDQQLKKFDDYFRTHGEAMTEKERLFSRIVKLNEEVGELCEAALCEFDSNQRTKDKVTDLDSEIADVVICTLLLARNRSKDVWIEVEKKVQKQLARFNLE